MYQDLLSALSKIKDEYESANKVAYLRKVEDLLEDYFVDCSTSKFDVELFYTYLMLEHILTILTGDVRYHSQSIKLAREVMQSICDTLDRLILSLSADRKDFSSFYDCYKDTVILYMKNARKINELLKGER